jgi:hypothetical protein
LKELVAEKAIPYQLILRPTPFFHQRNFFLDLGREIAKKK